MKFKNIPKQVFILGLISFFTDFASEMLYPVTPIFLTAVLGASMTAVGILEGIAEVTAGLLKGYIGAISDKIKKRGIFIIAGYGLSAIVKSLPGFFPTISVVVASRIGDRIGKGIRTAPRDALLAANSNKNSGAVFGFHRAMDTFGAVVGPLSALLILYLLPGDYEIIYLFAIIPGIAAIYFTFRVKDKFIERKSKLIYSTKEFWKHASTDYKKIISIMALFSLVNSSDVFLILKSMDIAKSDITAILGYVFYNAVYAFVSYPAGLLSDKLGKRNILITSLLVYSIVYLGFAINDNMFLIWILFAFYGIYSASSEGIAKAFISDLIDPQYHGTAIGLFTTIISLAVMLGSVIAGFLWDQFGSEVPFILSAIISGISALLLFSVKNKKQ